MLKKIQSALHPNSCSRDLVDSDPSHNGTLSPVRLVRSTSMYVVGGGKQTIIGSLKKYKSTTNIEVTGCCHFKDEDSAWMFAKTQDFLQYLQDLLALRKKYLSSLHNLRCMTGASEYSPSTKSSRTGKKPTSPENSACKYGFINTCLKSLVLETFGDEIWQKLKSLAGVQDTFMTYEVYDDVITIRMVKEASNMLKVSEEEVLKLFGQYFFSFCKKSGYDRMLRTLGGNLMEFIENLDALHSFLTLSYKEMNAPSFRVEKRNDGTMLLHYYSDRSGFCHIVPGIIESVAKDFFNSEITMSIVYQTEEKERTGKREHVIFEVLQKTEGKKKTIKPSTMLIALYPHIHKYQDQNEREISTDANMISLCCPVKKSHWDIIRNVVMSGRGSLLKSFQPVYPDRLWMDEKAFCNEFPFHIVFDKELKVKQAGVKIQKYVPGIQTMDIRLDEYFTIVHPQVTFTISNIQTFTNSQFVLRTKRETMPESWKKQPMLKLRGYMVWMESIQCMIYMCSPKLRSLQELEERKMHISDIAKHDVTRDLILLNHQRLAEIELSNQLERKKEELRILSRNLKIEKKKTETLLYAMLPPHVANQLKEGKKVQAGEFPTCTILFSDVVTFTNICSACEPIQIVNMLNAMYSRFDHLTNVHDVYKVETIGDAYMVVGGVPIPVETHVERVANFALGMRIAAREVINPITGDSIQIRVGIHTGPVLAGVVGDKMPRYCLFGDTVNTASRMESHGVPDKIHLSPTTFQALKHKDFDIVDRGVIDVKGKGKINTYFLIKNLLLSEEEIMGMAKCEDPKADCNPTAGCSSSFFAA
ncbi:PREDICTED: guanylate cyclase soluble subunit beta-2-like [Nanorana parkeri]|uniref:guanylate cyclase soluble subunit beta-2-like n=1 Tax=Nanorana parkeri TaxID=125878 RepID=UPI0008549032|nr:PREDICTED: guanylate cyclase soluble subunit beta-2-like [Nanorana parkeri]